MSGFFTNGIPQLTSANGGAPLTGAETYPVDTNKTQGLTPETGCLSGQTMGLIGIGPEIALGTVSSGTINVDCTLGSFFSVTIGSTGHTLSLNNPSPGQLIEVEVTQGAGGSKTITTYQTKLGAATAVPVAFAANTAPTLTATAAHTDVLKFRYGGSPNSASSTVPCARGESVLDVRNA